MKLIYFLYVFIFVILNCINTFASGKEDDFILRRIYNDTRMCINGDIYVHKQLKKCMKVVPEADVNDDNDLDVLCMSLYDSFLLLCENNQNKNLKDKIPQTLKEFNKLVDSLGKDQTADKFCTAVKENKNLKSHNKFNKTALWINFFISAMKENKTCMRICSTVGGIRLDPLCSLIVWANQLYSENSNMAAIEPVQSSVNRNNGTSGKIDTVNTNPNSVTADPKLESKLEREESEDEVVPVNEGVEKSQENGGDRESHLITTVEKAEGQEVAEREQEKQTAQEKETAQDKETAQEKETVQKKKQPTVGGINSTVEINVDGSSAIKAANENGQAAKPPENTNEDEPEHKNESNKKADVNSHISDINEDNSFTPRQNVDNDVNVKGISDDGGGNGLSNDEENNENREFVIDENAGADGLEHEEESDDVQIPSSVKEVIPAVPVQNKQQTLNEQHTGINAVMETNLIVRGDPFVEAEESHFFTYFISMAVLSIIMYLVFHNKKKLVALAVEGRRTRSTTRRRPNTASYSKLDCNLEEAMVSNTTASVTHVLY